MIRVNGKSNLGGLAGMVDVREPRLFKIFKLCKSHSEASLCGDDVNAHCILYPASISEIPAPDAVFVSIKISYKMFYPRFSVFRV